MILKIEILSLIVMLILAVLWAVNQAGNYEPFTIMAVVVSAAMEIYRRKASSNATREPISPPGEGGAGGNAKAGGGSGCGRWWL